MVTLFISEHCPDTLIAFEAFQNSNIPIEVIDITSSMQNLKLFLSYRDSHPFFEEAKKNKRVGIPTVMVNNGEKFIDLLEDRDLKILKNYLEISNN